VQVTRVVLVATYFILGAFLSACSVVSPTAVPPVSGRLQTDPEAIAALPDRYKADGILTAAIDPTYAPNESTDIHGNPVGWEVELGNAIGARLGMRIQYSKVAFANVLPAVKLGTYDLAISSITDTATRHADVDMIDYYSAGTQWAQLASRSNVNPGNACGLKIAVQKDTYQATVDLVDRSKACVAAGQPKIIVLSYALQADADESVKLGHADALVADSPVAQYAVKSSNGLLEVVSEPYDVQFYGLAVQKDSQLVKAISIAIQSLIDDGTYLEILKSWGVEQGAVASVSLNGGK
jgi:polar amino acid transport system substrate-binding protein